MSQAISIPDGKEEQYHRHVDGLECRECGESYPKEPVNTCEECFGPLEVDYDLETVVESVDIEKIEDGPESIWRYAPFLPVDDPSNAVDLGAGFNKLHRADNLANELGLDELYVLDDSVNPTYSFKDRVTSVATTKALEFDCSAVGCASTGNLAGSVSAHAAKAGLPAYIFIPDSIEMGKVVQMLVYGADIVPLEGNYDDANRLASEVADNHDDWGFVNINLRPYYTEGSKTMAFETAEQLGWEAPDHYVAPMASGAMLCSIKKGFEELERTGLIEDGDVRASGSQPEGCSPISTAVREGGSVEPIRDYETVAHSLAIGNPADGFYAKDAIEESGGYAAAPTDGEVLEGIKLLAETEGIFTEPAGGTTITGLKNLVDEGYIERDERTVVYVTGNGLKATEPVTDHLDRPGSIEPTVEAFEDRVL